MHNTQAEIKTEIRLLSEHDAALFLGISYSMIRDLRFRGDLPFIKINRRILYDREDLDSYIERVKKVEGG